MTIRIKRAGTQEQLFKWVKRKQTSNGPHSKAKIISLAFVSENSSLRKSRVTGGSTMLKEEQARTTPRLWEEKGNNDR